MKLELNVDYLYWKKGQKIEPGKTKNTGNLTDKEINRMIDENVFMVLDEEAKEEVKEEKKEEVTKTESKEDLINEAKNISSKKELDVFASKKGIELDRRKSHLQMLKDFIKGVKG